VEAIQNMPNPFRLNTDRWKRHQLLLDNGKTLVIRDYSRLLRERGLPPATKKYFRSAIKHGCILIVENDGTKLDIEQLSEFMLQIG